MIRCRPGLWLGILLGVGLLGCGGETAERDSASARSTLETALEAWKRGDSPTALKAGSPPLNVADYRWESGYKLTSYTIAENPTAAGFDQRFSVELKLTSPKGKASREKAGYLVATAPALAVVRDPES